MADQGLLVPTAVAGVVPVSVQTGVRQLRVRRQGVGRAHCHMCRLFAFTRFVVVCKCVCRVHCFSDVSASH